MISRINQSMHRTVRTQPVKLDSDSQNVTNGNMLGKVHTLFLEHFDNNCIVINDFC